MKKELIEQYTTELKSHPAILYADSVITFNALRSGTKGYTGKENLVQFLERVLDQVYDKVEAKTRGDVFELLHKKFMATKDEKIMNLLEELQKEILNDLGKSKKE